MGVCLYEHGTVPRYPIFSREDFIVSGAEAAVGSDATVGTSARLCAFPKGMLPAQTPLDTMLMGKRAPSSLYGQS